MATKLGDYLRKLRLSNSEVLKDMAEKLKVSSAFLSAVENGKKKIPASWRQKLQEIYNLSSEEMENFEKAIMESSDVVELNIKNTSSSNRDLAISFARQFESMDDKTSKELLAFLKKKQKQEE